LSAPGSRRSDTLMGNLPVLGYIRRISEIYDIHPSVMCMFVAY